MSQLKTFAQVGNEIGAALQPYLDAYIDHINTNALGNLGAGDLGATKYATEAVVSAAAVAAQGGSLNSNAKSAIAASLVAHAHQQGFDETTFSFETVPERRFKIILPSDPGAIVPSL